MISCPHCHKGLLWGIYLDVPPEMKAGHALWVACEPPEHEASVTCPNCNQDAGAYGDLYSASADSRRLAKMQKKSELLQLVTPIELPAFTLLGCALHGNNQREAFLKEAWLTVFEWIQALKKEHLLPRQGAPEGMPAAIGVQIAENEYFAGIPLWAEPSEKLKSRLQNPEYDDPKEIGLLAVEAGLYVQFRFAGAADEFGEYAMMPKLIQKEWLPTQPFANRVAPALDLYASAPYPWPPAEQKPLHLTFALPIEPKPMVEETSGASVG